MPVRAPQWTNWARTATAVPTSVARPGSLGEIVETVRGSTKVKALGAGHSFTEIAVAHPATAIDLGNWTGIESADREDGLVTVRAGTTIKELNAKLDRLGLAMANLGD